MDAEMRDPKTRDFFHEFQKFKDHEEITNRFKKTFYYGRLPKTQRSSLPLTEATVEFFAKAVPNSGLDIVDIHYAASISRRACISPCSMMLAMVYIKQLKHKNPEYLQSVSSCDLFLVSMMVASKYLYDDAEEDEVLNYDWAASAKMELQELNQLEREFLAAIDWKLFIKPSYFFQVLRKIEIRIAHHESQKRNSGMTYTDANVMSNDAVLSLCWGILLEDVIKVVLVTSVAYVSALAMLFTAASVAPHCTSFLSSSVHLTTAPTSIQESFNDINCTNSLMTQVYYNQDWHHLLQFHVSPTDLPFQASSSSGNTSSSNPKTTTIYDQGFKNFLHSFWTLSPHEGEDSFHSTFGNQRRFSLWNTFQYWPTCCGINSYLL